MIQALKLPALVAGVLLLTGCAERLATISDTAGDEIAGTNDVVAKNIWRSLCAMPMGAAYRRLAPEDFERLVEIIKATDGTCGVKP